MNNFKDMTEEDIFKYIIDRIQRKIHAEVTNIKNIKIDPTNAVNFLLNASLLIDIVCEVVLGLAKEQK